MRLTAPPNRNTGRRDTEGMAVASFVLGLVGLLVLNLVLGPVAIALAVISLRRGTPRPFRARLGLFLGIADLAVLAVLMAVNGGAAWNAFG
ncbi:DUF4190 domain-containing protein [Streptomyces minutiscleroticus]|uniref:DUF4190 domain-containing protein n=1 Tax=Streptomyces minutiscleroticus TaxID=68238 RepID=A0A918KQH6_9ACTN|nr:DUF4190 domain-containing protein [Streptomyces minutiscleroticus]GGX72744.1 hypothetical protein GCM10010358_28770 [Streptomyces minutiscleroticus]